MRLGEALSKPSKTKQSVAAATIHEGQILTGPLFSEPMLVETVRSDGPGTWIAGLVGQQSERFRRVTLTADDIATLTIADSQLSYDGDGRLLRLGLQAYSLGIAYEFEPYFGLSISRVDPLPHQLEAVYEHLLKLPRVRFLLADDAGAGKTIMAGLLIRELKLRGLIERTLVACPANLAFQWQRELNEKFDEKFVVLKGGDIRDQFGVNQWLEQRQIITSLDLAKRTDILPGLAQVRWDLVIVDEAHRMSARDETHKSQRYRLGELLPDSADHVLLLTATPHKGDPQNFTLPQGVGIPGGLHPRRHEARLARRSRNPAPRRAAVSRGRHPGPGRHRGGRRRDQPAVLPHPLQLRHPVESEPPRTADGPHPPLRTATRLPDLQLRRDERHRGTGPAAAVDKLQEIRDALDDDAVFNLVGEVLPSAHVERVLRDFYAGKLGEEDFEDRLLKDVDEDRFRSICQTALKNHERSPAPSPRRRRMVPCRSAVLPPAPALSGDHQPKLGRLTHADAGQMHLYLNYAREHRTHESENPPVGLIQLLPERRGCCSLRPRRAAEGDGRRVPDPSPGRATPRIGNRTSTTGAVRAQRSQLQLPTH